MAATQVSQQELDATSVGEYKYGFHDEVTSVFRTRRGLDEDVVREISANKQEPAWMTRPDPGQPGRDRLALAGGV
jgi:hypothetical protein